MHLAVIIHPSGITTFCLQTIAAAVNSLPDAEMFERIPLDADVGVGRLAFKAIDFIETPV